MPGSLKEKKREMDWGGESQPFKSSGKELTTIMGVKQWLHASVCTSVIRMGNQCSERGYLIWGEQGSYCPL